MKGRILFLSCLAAAAQHAQAQQADTLRIPAGVPVMLNIVPDARTGALGMAGAALSPDANATFINPAKLAVAEEDFGVSASYTPYLRNLVNNMWVGYASAYKKLGDKQAIGLSGQYFKYGDLGVLAKASDLALSGTYARQLGRNFSMGLTVKYISSDWGSVVINNQMAKPGRTVAADLSAFYRKEMKNEMTGQEFSWSLGAVLANIGNKIDYALGDQHFLPAKIRLGGGISYTGDGRHRINVIADVSKLMVPTPVSGQNTGNIPLVQSWFKSFSDAPGGFQEELQEIVIGAGAEYWYKDALALRAGYYNEDKRKGGLRAVTVGAGGRILDRFQADFAYLIPVDKENPLANTYRITASFYLKGKKE